MSLYVPHSMHQAYGSQSAAAAYMQSSGFYNSPAYGMLQQGYHSAAGTYWQLFVCVFFKYVAVISKLLAFFH